MDLIRERVGLLASGEKDALHLVNAFAWQNRTPRRMWANRADFPVLICRSLALRVLTWTAPRSDSERTYSAIFVSFRPFHGLSLYGRPRFPGLAPRAICSRSLRELTSALNASLVRNSDPREGVTLTRPECEGLRSRPRAGTLTSCAFLHCRVSAPKICRLSAMSVTPEGVTQTS